MTKYTIAEIDAAYTACVMAIPNERFIREVAESMFACMTMREATGALKIWMAHPERSQYIKAHMVPGAEQSVADHIRAVTEQLRHVGEA